MVVIKCGFQVPKSLVLATSLDMEVAGEGGTDPPGRWYDVLGTSGGRRSVVRLACMMLEEEKKGEEVWLFCRKKLPLLNRLTSDFSQKKSIWVVTSEKKNNILLRLHI